MMSSNTERTAYEPRPFILKTELYELSVRVISTQRASVMAITALQRSTPADTVGAPCRDAVSTNRVDSTYAGHTTPPT